MELDFYHVDAFADGAFKGNPAAVFVLQEWLTDELMQAIAAEFNLSETVFSVLEGNNYRIRWFTPEAEVALCGHATLATSHVFHQHLDYKNNVLPLISLSGELSTRYENGIHTLDFPANPPAPENAPEGLADILGCDYVEALCAAQKLIVIIKDETQLAKIQPDFFKMTKLPYSAVCVAAISESSELDFVCRFFAPAIGVNEDPVTGSAYTMLTPYFAEKCGRSQLKARQLSKRSGDVAVELRDDRVLISGKAHTVMQGKYYLDSL